ncbi:hypothetical protein FX985_00619 [Pseudomonas extremaustralis]|uniref:Uncharacterized protein n=1 Tax=Pseudomonas extremaustralis TaxID=359110 RepID=A0A5M9IXH9_9PSED|nr:hypothetical protein [Pseudomonas extremaustralis]KAA8560569.1 hypothetical protein FX985_00619 [Pseudomonas extremaustralis]
MSEIISRIKRELAKHYHYASEPRSNPVIYVGRVEFYDLLVSMQGCTPVHIEYADDVRRVTFEGLELIEVCMPKYLRVA